MSDMKQSVYIETTIPSYLTARPSTDVVMLGHQHITREWWEKEAGRFELFVSELVLDEAGRGDVLAAGRRLEVLSGYTVLTVTDDAFAILEVYLKELPIPPKADADALHLAIASVYRMDYLLTWNCRHIANGAVKRLLPDLNAIFGLRTPTICTPEELFYENFRMD